MSNFTKNDDMEKDEVVISKKDYYRFVALEKRIKQTSVCHHFYHAIIREKEAQIRYLWTTCIILFVSLLFLFSKKIFETFA